MEDAFLIFVYNIIMAKAQLSASNIIILLQFQYLLVSTSNLIVVFISHSVLTSVQVRLVINMGIESKLTIKQPTAWTQL